MLKLTTDDLTRRWIGAALLACLCAAAAPARAQIEAKTAPYNSLRQTPVVSPAVPPVITPQFSGMGVTGTSSTAVSTHPNYPERYPNAAAGGSGAVLTSSRLGYGFASGVPRFALGDVIPPPLTKADGVAPLTASEAAEYWRKEPVKPGEVFQNPGPPAGSEMPLPADAKATVYYSPHAERVFAHQNGRVSVLWVTNAPEADGFYKFRLEAFTVSAATKNPARSIYWTERGFNCPPVVVPTGKIVTVNPVFSTAFPETVAQEYKQVGAIQNPGSNLPEEKRTLWMENYNGLATLRAYNIEGRVMVEYLGQVLSPGRHEWLGADIVEVKQALPPQNEIVLLGDQILPQDKDARLVPSPVSKLSPDPGQPYTASISQPDGRSIYYAERESKDPDNVTFYWLENQDAAIHFLAPPAQPGIRLAWPKYLNKYFQLWPDDALAGRVLAGIDPLLKYAHYTVGEAGSTVDTGIAFDPESIPEVIFQDDPAMGEGRIDTNSQRYFVSLPVGGDGTNRTLLRFSNGSESWYVRLYSQDYNRTGFQEGDTAAAIHATAGVGGRIERPSAKYELGGYIAKGRAYDATAYKNPFAVGVEEAGNGAIIPVNASTNPGLPDYADMTVWWFEKISPTSSRFRSFFVPSKVGRYALSWEAARPAIINMASNEGSGDLSGAQLTGELYVQNNSSAVGFNPNEEHAVLIAGRIYALRDDLNSDLTSAHPLVLLRYVDPADNRPNMSAFRVIRESDRVRFTYRTIAGTQVAPPMPLPILPLAVDADGKSKNTEVPSPTPDPAPNTAAGSAIPHYDGFTFKDRKGYSWVFRGPHAPNPNRQPSFQMKFWYPMLEGFYVPTNGAPMTPQNLAAGTPLPYLRPGVMKQVQYSAGGTTVVADVPVSLDGDPVSGDPLVVTYRPEWPQVVPELRVAETLTLAKFGLPAVRGQTSAQVVYEQPVANGGLDKASVTLHDPTREKSAGIKETAGLDALPPSLLTTVYQGKTYFQTLPPHLQKRLFFDPLRAEKGALVYVGEFVDEISGEDYLHLNVLTAEDVALIKALGRDLGADKAKWETLVDGLRTLVETFHPNPLRQAEWIVDESKDTVVDSQTLATATEPNTAVDSYALTATGMGAGYVTLLFGNGGAFTPSGDPVSCKIIRVVPQLYTGDLKVLLSSNPFDEQVTLRHSGDYAARPEGYEFEWRYAPPQGGAAPPIYTTVERNILGATSVWRRVANPHPATLAGELAKNETLTLPDGLVIRGAGYSDSFGGLLLRASDGSAATKSALDFTAGVPADLVFSGDFDPLIGFVLYINGAAALIHNVPDGWAPFDPGYSTAGATSPPAKSGLAPSGLSRQWALSGSFFRAGPNVLDLVLYGTTDLNAQAPSVSFRLDTATETDRVAQPGSPWLKPNGKILNQTIVGGSPSAPLGSPLLVMTDNYFTMRYRPLPTAGSVAEKSGAEYKWSRWMPQKLVEGWIKRVLAAINPFNQRVNDLYNNAISTDVSVLTQAGKRWEGDIPLTLQGINDVGLIEIYETVLNRGKALSIDSNYDYAPANDALLLVAGYLNDLYQILGNEAYSDAANPTISIDDSGSALEVNTSRFSFEGQVASLLDEELCLLRGRDDFLSPGVRAAPFYNRLVWNYTRGINSGEVIYATNYNIKEKAGGPYANGRIDASDAYYQYPQGHGDAYGHYLTALTGYYRLITNRNFTWTPRSEAVTVLGQAVQVDYFDERKFAAAAAALARTAREVLTLTHRQAYRDDPAEGWAHYGDSTRNDETSVERNFGLDDWASRATQGAYYHWITGNSMLPEKDMDPSHHGIEVIDRTTVPELQQLASMGASFQTTMDNANARLNPLGLSPDAIAFDISPAELKAGRSHFEQVYDRALGAARNAKGAFDQAARQTRYLRNQDNSIDDYNAAVESQERSFQAQLREIYGTAYPGEIGPGKAYAQGYDGPDLLHWYVVDRPAGWPVDTSETVTIKVREPVEFQPFGFKANAYAESYTAMTERTVAVEPNSVAQFADGFSTSGSLGRRRIVGSLQSALLDSVEAFAAVREAGARHALLLERFNLQRKLFDEMSIWHANARDEVAHTRKVTAALKIAAGVLDLTAKLATKAAEKADDVADAGVEGVPKVVGLANDATSPIRGALKAGAIAAATAIAAKASTLQSISEKLKSQVTGFETALADALLFLEFNYQEKALIFELSRSYDELVVMNFEVAEKTMAYQRTLERIRNELAEGDRIQTEREIFRTRAAAIIQGSRTRDVAFRIFRNEALEQYRSLFDLASRYAFLAAKSYDYETGLLGTTQGRGVFSRLVASRSLGDLNDGVPVAGLNTLGDAGLSGSLAQLQADWSVAEGRLGLNNPDYQGTLFSLRSELYRVLDDAQWRQVLEQHMVANVMTDDDVVRACLNIRKPDGAAVPGIVLPFRTTIQQGLNWFGLPLAGGDHAYSSSSFATKVYSAGMVLKGYQGMDVLANGNPGGGQPGSSDPNALSATPYVYLVPVGIDQGLAPPLGDTGLVRSWSVADQALPLPFNLGGNAFNGSQFFDANDTLTEQPWITRKHQAFRAVNDAQLFYSMIPDEFTSSRLVGRSVWNSAWKIVIPAYTLLNNEQEGLRRFAASVKDIQIFLRTYSYSGN